MGRTFMTGAALVILGASIAVQPAQAKDRKSAAANENRAAFSDMIAQREAHSRTARQDPSSASVERVAAVAATVDRTSGNRNGTPTAPLREQPAATPSPLSLKFGAVTLQPAVGGIKGAKFSIGF